MIFPVSWTCMCCHDTREDQFISVLSGERRINDVPMRFNVRYCNDRPGCLAIARIKIEAWEHAK